MHQDLDTRPQGAVGTVPWGIPACIAVLVLTTIAVVASVTVLHQVAPAAAIEGIGLLLPLAMLAVVTLLWVHVRHRGLPALTGPERGGPKEWVLGFGVGVAAFVVVNIGLSLLIRVGAAVVGIDLPETQPGLREAAQDPERIVWMLLAAVVIAPVAEELYFRGMVHQALRRRLGRWMGIILSAVVFAGAHVLVEPDPRGGALVFVLILPVGVFLAWLFERRGTLAAPIAAHAGFNATTTAMMVLAGGGIVAGG